MELSKSSEPDNEQNRMKFLNECMEHYGDDVKRVIFSYVKNYADTDDLAQDVFVKVYQRFDQFKGDATLKSWIISIAINMSKDYLRSFKARQNMIKKKINQFIHREPTQTPESESIRNENSDELLNEIYRLPLIYREIIILYYFEEFPLKEIAELLDVNINTAKARLRRGRDLLKDRLLEVGGGHDGSFN